jgi:hypothetical protein
MAAIFVRCDKSVIVCCSQPFLNNNNNNNNKFEKQRSEMKNYCKVKVSTSSSLNLVNFGLTVEFDSQLHNRLFLPSFLSPPFHPRNEACKPNERA